MNSVQIVGNICRDIERRETQGGVPVVNFGVAVNRPYKNQAGQYEADFIDVVAWRETADFIHRHFIKGNKIGLTGRIQTRQYTAQDGSKRKVFEVIADSVEFVAPKATPAPDAAPLPPMAEADAEDQGELPF